MSVATCSFQHDADGRTESTTDSSNRALATKTLVTQMPFSVRFLYRTEAGVRKGKELGVMI